MTTGNGNGRRAMVTAVAVQKGGEGKTTAAVNISAYFAIKKGLKVCLVDMDASGNATVAVTGNESKQTIMDVIEKRTGMDDIIRTSPFCPALSVIPGGKTMAGFTQAVSDEMSREYKLLDTLEETGILDRFDHIFIDSPPTLGLPTVNILTVADNVIIPVQCTKFSAQGLVALVQEIGKVRRRINQRLKVLGVFVNMWSGREILQRSVLADLEEFLSSVGLRMFSSKVRDSVSINEAVLSCRPVFLYKPGSIGSDDISALAEEVYGTVLVSGKDGKRAGEGGR